MRLVLLAALLIFQVGCEPSVNRYICVDLMSDKHTLDEVDGRGTVEANAATALETVDYIATVRGFSRVAPDIEKATHFERKYRRDAHVPGERGVSLMLNAQRRSEHVVISLMFFRGKEESELMRSVRLDLTSRLVEQFGEENVSVAANERDLKLICADR